MVGGCSTNILHGIDERSANEATAALERAGIGAEKHARRGRGGRRGATYTIRVAHADGTRAVDLLRALGLPHDRRRGFAETYGQPSLIPTPSEERARYVDALAGEIERTLESADGVVSARVHLVLEESDPLAADAQAAQSRRAPRCCSRRVPAWRRSATADVQKLVAGSVAGPGRAGGLGRLDRRRRSRRRGRRLAGGARAAAHHAGHAPAAARRRSSAGLALLALLATLLLADRPPHRRARACRRRREDSPSAKAGAERA